MNTSLSKEALNVISERLSSDLEEVTQRYPGETGTRQPVHTVYGGAHLFRSDTAVKLGALAVQAMSDYAPDPETLSDVLGIPAELAGTVFRRVKEKLEREAVEDFRIDFEDGYGYRPDAEEDRDAISAAIETAKALDASTLPPFIGIRIKPLSLESHARSIRTLDLYLTSLMKASGGRLPDNFVVTLPKIISPEQVGTLVDTLAQLESKLGLGAVEVKMEMMIETTQSIVTQDGRIALPLLLRSAGGRCLAAHFGAYDYTASCNITSAYQDMLHPACDFARNMIQAALAGTGIWLSDGATNIMPVPPNRGQELSPKQLEENRNVVHRAWKLHYDHCRHSLANAFYQGWDLHPAQLPTRYAAIHAFFLEGLDAASERLRNFVEKAAQATLVGDVFDDAATGQGLLNYFLRAMNCGAVTEEEVLRLTGLTINELRSGSFVSILESRRA